MSILRICLGAAFVVTAIGCGAPADPASSSTTMRLTGTADRSTSLLATSRSQSRVADDGCTQSSSDQAPTFCAPRV